MKTRLIIVAAPSGAGKSSFVEKISQEDPRLVDIITFTTRSMRKGESEGHPYHFISSEDFQKKIEEGFFVEWARVHTNYYGTSYDSIETSWKHGKCAIMDIDIQGVATFKSKFPDAKTVFILPPSIDELRRRIAKRDGGMPADIEVRMANAEKELREASKFDYQIVNDVFEHSYAQFKKIVEELLA
ncbi:guanylate kinase [Bdellovibrio bacteriovorus]|uniref:Guanylate kinase n=1 Tax=Bdellovibrio bacteriovorus TaxID=959 RepID=A0A150WBP3_BDEBC|nr:guanylate kinase [Bdellovibrio bacteriovorus]KYG60389.1 guanylate kinase [Bdellovibrio bacteriovorus]